MAVGHSTSRQASGTEERKTILVQEDFTAENVAKVLRSLLDARLFVLAQVL